MMTMMPVLEEPSHCNTENESSSASITSNSSTNNFEADTVKRDNRMVTLVRIVVMLVLLTTAVVTSYYSFDITRNSQIKAFEEAFEGISWQIAPGLLDDVTQRLWQASTIAAVVKSKLVENKDLAPHLLNLSPSLLFDISNEARLFAKIHHMGWNPLLNNEEEREEFEEMALTRARSANDGGLENLATGQPTCYICGSPTQAVSNPDTIITIPGIGPLSCGYIHNGGLGGLVPNGKCELLSYAVTTALEYGCKCFETGEIQESNLEIPQATKVSTIDEESGYLVPIPPNETSFPFMPLWNGMGSSFVPSSPTMLDRMSPSSHSRPAIERMMETNLPQLTESIFRTGPFYEKHMGSVDELSTTLFYPVAVGENDKIVGSISFDLLWKDVPVTSRNPELSNLVHIVVENNLGQNFTFGVGELRHQQLIYIGEGDLHEQGFDASPFSTTYEHFFHALNVASSGQSIDKPPYCQYRFHVFATQQFQDRYINSDPIYYAASTAAICAFTSLVFIFYDFLVRRLQRKVVASAKHTTAIVSSLFPKNVRDRLLQQAADQSNESENAPMRVSKMRMQNFLVGGDSEDNATSTFNSEPIADLFASATVMFLDIVSFTAWSSEREPSQVFILLETIYQAFDQIAGKLSVFKVETIGDSYVAVCGLPTRREVHAPVMAKFARQCLAAMEVVTKNLEVRLGPSTGDLMARVGLHSGPVTAGVMRGEKARFQLFGDTVNTAARLESSGMPGCIHASQACVNLLEKAGKGNWARKRDNLVSMKGKGDLQTYFLRLETEEGTGANHSTRSSIPRTPSQAIVGGRLIDWNTEVLFSFMKRIVIHRFNKRGRRQHAGKSLQLGTTDDGNLVIDELTQTLNLPTVARNTSGSADRVKISPKVKPQLRAYVQKIASMYRDVPFHNFEHCSHVLMSTSKLMKRIVNPDDIDYKQTDDLVAKAIHKTTYGISSDPILQFASLFAALIHDVDHTGLTNTELIDERAPLAATYRNQSVAEQNSVDLAWSMLMEPDFEELRSCIYNTQDELVHFRQLVVNAVMATDIADKELKQAREKRWDETFPANSDSAPVENAQLDKVASQTDRDRKATIVFEYIIQASDVCHTMQHWHTYQKFNKRLFEERYVAWLNGSLKKEPSLGWYGGELWFFDNYIIPMANKLDKCGVFGVSYQEYLTYAKENRVEWERKGEEIVKEMKLKCDHKYASQRKMEADDSTGSTHHA